jgi:hypothetical protein
VPLFSKIPVKFRVLLPVCAVVALSSCLGNSGDPAAPPPGVAPISGDGLVGINWESQFNVNYLAFGSTNPTLTTENFATIGFPIINAPPWSRAPAILCNAPNGLTYYFTVDARTGTAPGGPAAPVVTATGRPAGGAGTWKRGNPLGVKLNGVGYGAITSCLPSGLATGVFAAVGPAGTVFSSTDGINWTSRTPSNFGADLYSVVVHTTTLNNPPVAGLLFVAVGAGGAVLRSGDGINWTLGAAFNPSAPTLRSVSLASAGFVAVGDNGRIQTSPDGVTWTVQNSGTTVNLHAVTCVSTACVAVGDAGLVDLSFDGGGLWTQQTLGGGTAALRAVVYGNNDNNETANGVIGLGGSAPTSINTWVIVGDGGTAFQTTTLGTSTGTIVWNPVPIAGAADLVAVSYTTHFLAVDSAGNAFSSELAIANSWTPAVATGVTDPVSIVTNGSGYVLVGAGGENATAF